MPSIGRSVRRPENGRSRSRRLPARTSPSAVTGPVERRTEERFRALDAYRVDREWKRYEGTGQRELFRVLRERFLARNAARPGWALEVGPGPGRFSPWVGGEPGRRVLLDLSREALRRVRTEWGGRSSEMIPQLAEGNARRPPFRRATFTTVVGIGNVVGFAGDEASQVLDAVLSLVAPGGSVVLESVAGPGEFSRYLHRLPPGAVGRLFRAPPAALHPRIAREGFSPRSHPRADHGFQRLGESGLRARFAERGIELTEAIAVAPVLGAEPERVEAIARDPVAFAHLLEIEERFGRSAERRATAEALLVAGRRPLAQPTS